MFAKSIALTIVLAAAGLANAQQPVAVSAQVSASAGQAAPGASAQPQVGPGNAVQAQAGAPAPGAAPAPAQATPAKPAAQVPTGPLTVGLLSQIQQQELAKGTMSKVADMMPQQAQKTEAQPAPIIQVAKPVTAPAPKPFLAAVHGVAGKEIAVFMLPNGERVPLAAGESNSKIKVNAIEGLTSRVQVTALTNRKKSRSATYWITVGDSLK